MINNTIYTSNSGLGTVLAGNNISSFINQTVQNIQKRQNALSKLSSATSYADMLKAMQERFATTETETETETKKSTVDMNMDEYKAYFAEEIKNFDFDASRFDDDEIIRISDAGWKAMKSNPNYESWVLNKIKSSRQTSNQLAAMGFGGSYYFLNFGADSSEFKEETWVKNFSKLDNFFSGIYNSTSFFTSNSSKSSKKNSSGFGNIFSMQAERLKLQTQLTKNYMQLNQNVKASLAASLQNLK